MYLTEEHEAIREMTRHFADNEIRPVANELDEAERFPAEIYAQMAGLGLFGICAPEEYGGAGADAMSYAIVMEELSRGYASVADQCGLVELIATLLTKHGTNAQKEKYLRPLLKAELRCAYALTEPDSGSDLASLRTTAVRDGDDWVLNGEKIWIHNAPVCDFAVVLTRTDKTAGHRGMSIFIVDRVLDGFTLRSQGTQDGPAGIPGRGAAFQRCTFVGRCHARRRGARLPHDDERAGKGADGDRLVGRGHHAGRARGRHRTTPRSANSSVR